MKGDIVCCKCSLRRPEYPDPTLEPGINISSANGIIDWEKVKDTGVKHVSILMEREDEVWEDRFVSYWNGATGVGLNVNCHHNFTLENCTVEDQWESIQRRLRSVNFDPFKNNLAIQVNYLGGESATPEIIADKLYELINLIDESMILKGHQIVIHSQGYLWDTIFKNTPYNFSRYQLWIEHWNVRVPRIPLAWRKNNPYWYWWKYSVEGKVDGIEGFVHMNWVNVNKAKVPILER